MSLKTASKLYKYWVNQKIEAEEHLVEIEKFLDEIQRKHDRIEELETAMQKFVDIYSKDNWPYALCKIYEEYMRLLRLLGSKDDWFGKACVHQSCQFEEGVETKARLALVFCEHPENPKDTEGNCNSCDCPPLNS